MLPVKKDAAHNMIALPDHPDFLRRLDEIDRLKRIQQLSRHTTRPAARLRGERYLPLTFQQFLIRPLNLLLYPRLEDGVLCICDADGRLFADPVGVRIAQIWIGGIIPDRTV